MNLPHEIYLKIFKLLHKSSVKNCVMVCKDWSQPAFQVYFKELIINEHKMKNLKTLVNQEEFFKYCHWTEKVYIHPSEYDDDYFSHSRQLTATLTKPEFLKFFEYFPNLKKIEIRNDNKYEYTKYLLDIDANQYLTRLEDIIFKCNIFDSNPHDLYSTVYYNFRNSLTRVILQHNNEESVLSSQYGGILNYLNQFKKLTHLKYYNDSKYYIPINEIQTACPSLTSIKIHENGAPLFQAGDNMFYQNSNLKELTLSFSNIPGSYIGFITEYLPESVKSLNISIMEIDLYDWIAQVGIENVLRLAERMSKLPEASLEWIPDKEYETEHGNTGESNMTIFFKVLNSFKGNKKVPCTASFSDFRSVHNSMHFSGGKLNMEYGLNYADLYDDSGERPVLEFAVPDRTISIVGPEIINNLSFYICIRNTELALKLLKYSLTNCPHLQYVEFNGMNSPRQEFILCSSIGAFPRRVEKYGPSIISMEIFKVVKLKNFIPSQEFIDLLSCYSPGMEIIICGTKNHGHFNDNEETHDYVVDLTRFKSLKFFCFDVELVIKDPVAICLIKLVYADGEEKYYQFSDKNDGIFKLIPLENIQNNQTLATISITFKCEKIEKFTFYSTRKRNVVEILRGIPHKERLIEADDMVYLYL